MIDCMAERVRVRDIDPDEGQKLLRIVRRSSGSVVTWRRAQMILLSAQGMSEPNDSRGVCAPGSRRVRLASSRVCRTSASTPASFSASGNRPATAWICSPYDGSAYRHTDRRIHQRDRGTGPIGGVDRLV